MLKLEVCFQPIIKFWRKQRHYSALRGFRDPCKCKRATHRPTEKETRRSVKVKDVCLVNVYIENHLKSSAVKCKKRILSLRSDNVWFWVILGVNRPLVWTAQDVVFYWKKQLANFTAFYRVYESDYYNNADFEKQAI